MDYDWIKGVLNHMNYDVQEEILQIKWLMDDQRNSK